MVSVFHCLCGFTSDVDLAFFPEQHVNLQHGLSDWLLYP